MLPGQLDSIIPLGAPVESTNEAQPIATVRVYAGKDADFDLYRDDGNTYAYEGGASEVTRLHWSQATRKLSGSAAKLEIIK